MTNDGIARLGRLIFWILIVSSGVLGLVTPFLLSEEWFSSWYGGLAPAYSYQQRVLAQSPVSNISHRMIGFALLVLGMMQFNANLRDNHRELHRWIGRAFLFLGCIVAATAIVLAWRHAFEGLPHTLFVCLLSAAFIFSAGNAFRYALNKQFKSHREWMIRGFAILMHVSVHRLYQGIGVLATDIGERELFMPAGISAIATTLVVAEWWIRRTRSGVTHFTPEIAAP